MRKRRGGFGWTQQTFLAIFNHFRDSTDGSRNYGESAGHCFQQHIGASLGQAGQDKDVGGIEPQGNLCGLLYSRKQDILGNASGFYQGFQFITNFPVTYENELNIIIFFDDFGNGLNKVFLAFDGRHSANVKDEDFVFRQCQFPSYGHFVQWFENIYINAI